MLFYVILSGKHIFCSVGVLIYGTFRSVVNMFYINSVKKILNAFYINTTKSGVKFLFVNIPFSFILLSIKYLIYLKNSFVYLKSVDQIQQR